MKRGMKSGQILILVLLIVVVTLSVGLSVAARNLTNLRSSTQTDQSQRAFTATEGGVEDVLSRFASIKTAISSQNPGSTSCIITPNTADCPVTVGDLSAAVNVKSSRSYELSVNSGQVGQVDLTGYSGAVPVSIEWGKITSPNQETAPYASIEVTFVCSSNPCMGQSDNISPGTYKQRRYAYHITGSLHAPDELGFLTCPASCVGPSSDFAAKVQFSISTANVLFVRIRPLWKATTIKVYGDPATFPVQTYEINSSSSTSIGVSRKVKVTRTALPTLPAVFDFGLYSENAISK